MKLKRKISGRSDILQKYINIMRNDEYLMRLLYYNPLDEDDNAVDFLSEDLPNVTEMEESVIDEIVDKHIRKSQKYDEIQNEKMSVIFVYYGKTANVFRNHTLVKREIIFHILSHNDFSFDDRISEICDRLDYLFAGQRIGGIGKTDTAPSFPREAPKEYLGFEQKYSITDKKR